MQPSKVHINIKFLGHFRVKKVPGDGEKVKILKTEYHFFIICPKTNLIANFQFS